MSAVTSLSSVKNKIRPGKLIGEKIVKEPKIKDNKTEKKASERTLKLKIMTRNKEFVKKSSEIVAELRSAEKLKSRNLLGDKSTPSNH